MPKRKLINGEASEYAIQYAYFQYISLFRELDYLVFHHCNEGRRTKSEGYSLKKIGLRPGVWDVQISLPRHKYNSAWIEFKSKNGRLSVEQAQFQIAQEKNGSICKVFRTTEDAIDFTEWYIWG